MQGVDFSLSSLAFAVGDTDFSLKAAAEADGLDVAAEADGLDNGRYLRPRVYRDNVVRPVLYEHAADMVADLDFAEGMRMFAVVSGNFVFGDVIEAIVLEKRMLFRTLTIQTLSLSKENIDSLRCIKNVCGGGCSFASR